MSSKTKQVNCRNPITVLIRNKLNLAESPPTQQNSQICKEKDSRWIFPSRLNCQQFLNSSTQRHRISRQELLQHQNLLIWSQTQNKNNRVAKPFKSRWWKNIEEINPLSREAKSVSLKLTQSLIQELVCARCWLRSKKWSSRCNCNQLISLCMGLCL